MHHTLHVAFAKSEDGIQAVRSLLYCGVQAEDIHLILPHPQPPALTEMVLSTADPYSAKAADTVASLSGKASTNPVTSQRRVLPNRHSNKRSHLAHPDPVPSKEPNSPRTNDHYVVVDAEEGAGLGLGLGLLTALCVPGIGMFVGSAALIAGLMAGGTVVGGIAGGIYGYLTDRGVTHGIAQVMNDHLEADGTILSVTVSEAHNVAEIVGILEEVGGHLIQPS